MTMPVVGLRHDLLPVARSLHRPCGPRFATWPRPPSQLQRKPAARRSCTAADGGHGNAPGPPAPPNPPPPSDEGPSGGTGQDSAPSTSASASASSAAADGPALLLGPALLERMAKLRALDEYRELLSGLEGAPGPGADGRGRQQRATSSGRGGGGGGGAAGDDSALLLRGAYLIARHRYPDLDAARVEGVLDEMGRRVAALLPAKAEARYPLRVVAAINQVMYRDFGFRGNEEDYYHPDNSCINRVMERRSGIPLTLSLVYMEVARRVGLPMRGLNLPMHYMLQPIRVSRPRGGAREEGAGGEPGSGGSGSSGVAPLALQGEAGVDADDEEEEATGPMEVLVDAFRGGEICYPAEAEERISGLAGERVRIAPMLLTGSQPMPPHKFLLRMLTNLRATYLNTQQVDSALAIIQYMRVTLECDPEAGAAHGRAASAASSALGQLARDEGLFFFALRRFPECLDSLREYLGSERSMPEDEVFMVKQVMEAARKRMQDNSSK